MKILHTSDWHLGQNFMHHSRENEHRNFLDWLLTQLDQQQIDTLVVAGDIFDTGTPPSYARTIYFDFLKKLQSTGCAQVIIVGGNHDSVSTLNESSGLLEMLNVHVIGGVTATPEQEVIVLNRRDGQPGAVIAAVPYLRDRDVRTSEAGESTATKSEALRKGITTHYEKVYDSALIKSKELGNLPILATGHLTTAGGELTEGVRELYIGSLNGYAEADFPTGFDYIALGHLHKKQIMGTRNHIRYCGSPIPLSFMEAKFDRSVNIVTLQRGEVPQIEELTVPRTQQLKSIRTNLEDLETRIEALDFSPLSGEEKIWLEIEVEDDGTLVDLVARIEEFTKDLPVEVLKSKRIRKKSSVLRDTPPAQKLSELQPNEVFAKRLQAEELSPEKQQQLTTLFKQAHAMVTEEQS